MQLCTCTRPAERVEPVPETHTKALKGSWQVSSKRESAGGPLRVLTKHGFRENSKWCQNPQFWIKTSAGAAAHETWRRGQPERVRSLSGDVSSGPGVMSFFSPGVETVSEAGVADAQRFYAVARPFEGVSCPAAYPSRTTARGARFSR